MALLTFDVVQWALIELAQHPEYQMRLRQELLSQFPNSDPTWDELTYGLPFLDAVVHEILRIHPSVHETSRQVSLDAPLVAPIDSSYPYFRRTKMTFYL